MSHNKCQSEIFKAAGLPSMREYNDQEVCDCPTNPHLSTLNKNTFIKKDIKSDNKCDLSTVKGEVGSQITKRELKEEALPHMTDTCHCVHDTMSSVKKDNKMEVTGTLIKKEEQMSDICQCTEETLLCDNKDDKLMYFKKTILKGEEKPFIRQDSDSLCNCTHQTLRLKEYKVDVKSDAMKKEIKPTLPSNICQCSKTVLDTIDKDIPGQGDPVKRKQEEETPINCKMKKGSVGLVLSTPNMMELTGTLLKKEKYIIDTCQCNHETMSGDKKDNKSKHLKQTFMKREEEKPLTDRDSESSESMCNCVETSVKDEKQTGNLTECKADVKFDVVKEETKFVHPSNACQCSETVLDTTDKGMPEQGYLKRKCEEESHISSKKTKQTARLVPSDSNAKIRDDIDAIFSSITGELTSCTICVKGFVAESELENHLLQHRWDQVLAHKCRSCKQEFQTKCQLEEHNSLIHGKNKDKVYVCNKCDNTFHSRKSLVSHRKKAHLKNKVQKKNKQCKEKRLYECRMCQENFPSASALQKHNKDLHHDERQHECSICKKRFPSRFILAGHMSVHSDAKPYNCDQCNRSFKYMSSLRTHLIVHSGKWPHSCETCGKGFNCKSQLEYHLPVHTGEKAHQCQICNKRFFSKGLLVSHMESHGDRDHECEQCGSRFKGKHALSCHMRSHHAEKKHKCDLCEKAFKTQKSLRKHRNTHSDERPFLCAKCDRRFKTKQTLKTHDNLAHQEDPRFKCDKCGEGFTTKIKLQNHLNQHDNFFPAKCNVCGAKFRSEQGLKKHMPLHTGLWPFSCSICGRGYNKKDRLIHHMTGHTVD